MAVQLKIARSAAELDDVYHLRYQVYVDERGKFSAGDGGNRRIVDHFDTLPGVVNLVAYSDEGKAIAAMRINQDSEIGLPAEHYFDFKAQRAELCDNSTSAADIRLVSPSMLAIHASWRNRRSVIFSLFKCAAGVMRSWDATHIIGSISLDTFSLYGRMGFKACGEARWHESVGDDLLPIMASFSGVFDWAFGNIKQQVDDFWLDNFCGQFERLLLKPGEVLFEQGDAADRTYAVDSGWVSIARRDPEGNEMVLANLAKGALFGELAIFDGGSRSAKATAVGNVELISIGREQLFDCLRANPDNLSSLLKHFALRVRETDELAMVQAFSPQASRVAFALNQLWQSADPDKKHPQWRSVKLGPEQIANTARVREYEVRHLLELRKAEGSLDYGEKSIRFYQSPPPHSIAHHLDSPI